MDIRLRPLREDEFAEFRAAQRREYVRSLVEEAGMTHTEAEEKAEADHASLFPDGVVQPQAAGLRGIDLNVWGENEAARRLYRSAGFSERAVFMSKELA